jgi:hypothetical protein
MAVGEVESTWALVPDTNPNSKARLGELKTLVSGWKGPGTLVLVTHALTIRPLVGFLPLQAEALVVKPTTDAAGFTLVGRIPPQ